jgi:type I restriction enzyme, S subunit
MEQLEETIDTLRQFRDLPGDWKIVRLKEAAQKGKHSFVDGPFGSDLKASDYTNSGIMLIQLQNVGDGIFYPDNKKYTSESKYKELIRHSTQAGDIVISKMSARACIVPRIHDRFLVVADCVKLEPDESKFDKKFLLYAINSPPVRRQAIKKSMGTTRLRIRLTELKELLIPFPSIVEQQKIAGILSRIDELIQKTDQFIEQAQRLKKGLMQRLLTKGIGHVEFKKVMWHYGKEIEIPKGWNVVLLDDVSNRGTGHTPDAKKLEYYNGGIKWISLADSNRLDHLYISDTTKEISEMGIENSSAVKHPPGTVVMSRDAGVGKSAILKSEMAVSQHFVSWRCKECLDNHFLYYLLQFWKPLFESIAIGTTIKTIGLPFFKKLRIVLPTVEEQKRIASILVSTDLQIEKEQEYELHVNNLKKGLMQKLLTGKIRVEV